jgi:hypothetical protein
MTRRLLALLLVPLLLVGCIPVIVSERPCASNGDCPYTQYGFTGWSNGKVDLKGFYWQPTREIVVPPGTGYATIIHEDCHAWQGLTCPADDIYLSCWLKTPAGLAFPRTPAPWVMLDLDGNALAGDTMIEDAARTCAAYVLDPEGLRALDPARYEWAREYVR